MEKEKLSLRPYQEEAIELVKVKNLIVNLDTGLGKTLIAVGSIDYHLNLYPEKKILLVVPTVELVTQQAQYCRVNCRTFPVPRVRELVGGTMSCINYSLISRFR
jgi:ERCC4-related helicase